MSEGIISLEELADAHVLTVEEIGFNLDYKASKIHIDLRSLLLDTVIGVKFVLAQGIGDVPDNRVRLGILFHNQTAVVGAHVFTSHMAGNRDFEPFARNSAILTYGAENIPRPKPILKEPILYGTRLLGGGEINRNQSQDVPYSESLRDNFGLSSLLPDHMVVVRRLVLEKLGIEHSA